VWNFDFGVERIKENGKTTKGTYVANIPAYLPIFVELSRKPEDI
jgi:hypothetical protein